MEAGISKKIIKKIEVVILNPKEFWKGQKTKKTTVVQLFGSYFLILAVLATLAVFLGEFFRSSHFYMVYAVLKAVREIVLFVLFYFISVYLSNELIKVFGGEKDLFSVYRLVTYSFTPMLLVSIITGLFPFLYALDIIGIYSFYIFWKGADEILKIPTQNKNSYILLTVIANFFTFSILSIILSKILAAYF